MLELHTFILGPVNTNTYLIGDSSSRQAAIIDPAAEGAWIWEKASQLNYSINQIWITHAHFDHIGGVDGIFERSGNNLTIGLHIDELDLWHAKGGSTQFGYNISVQHEPSLFISHGQILYLGHYQFEIRHVPGHTPGHVVYYCLSENLAFCGDLIFYNTIGRTDLPNGNYKKLIHSIQTQIFTMPDHIRLLPGHGEETSVGFEKVNNPFFN